MKQSDIDWLQSTLIFRGLSQTQLSHLHRISKLQSYRKGTLIFEQGNPATGFFLVKAGRVKVFQLSPTGKEQILNIFEPRDNFADVSALDGQPFPASAAALDYVELIFFPRLEVMELLYKEPDIAINMFISLSQHLRHLVGVIEDLSFKDVPQRLAEYLLTLYEANEQENRSPAQRSNIITLKLTKTQLAAKLGTVSSTLSRTFYRFSQEELIRIQGSQIQILNHNGLQELTQPSQQ